MNDKIVQRAIDGSVTDIGQLTKDELRSLKLAVKNGILWCIKGFTYPIPKKMYVKAPGYKRITT